MGVPSGLDAAELGEVMPISKARQAQAKLYFKIMEEIKLEKRKEIEQKAIRAAAAGTYDFDEDQLCIKCRGPK